MSRVKKCKSRYSWMIVDFGTSETHGYNIEPAERFVLFG